MEPHGDAPVLRWYALRAMLVLLLLRAGRPMTVAELVAGVHSSGFAVAGRPSRTISDALRAEVNRGRAVRVRRGTYRAGVVARSTRHRMQRVVAAMRNRDPLPRSG